MAHFAFVQSLCLLNMPAAQLFNPYGHDNLFTITDHNTPEWKVVRKAFATSMSAERIR